MNETEPATDYEPGDTVLIIEDVAIGRMTSPSILEAEVSKSGKSVMIPEDADSIHGRRRLDADTIFSGESEYRDSTGYQLYTPGRYQSNQRANYAPGPQSGSNQVSEYTELPTPTHWPQIETPDDAPDQCPNCGQTTAPWNGKKVRPHCEACGELAPESNDNDNDNDTVNDDDTGDDGEESRPDKWDLSRLERGDVLTLDGYRGEFLIGRIRYMVGSRTVNRIDAATYDARDGWTTYTLRKIDAAAGKRLEVQRDDEDRGLLVDVNDDRHARDFEIIRRDDEDFLRRYIRECYYGNDDGDDDSGGSDYLVTDGGATQTDLGAFGTEETDA